MRYDPIPQVLFTDRRKTFIKKMKPQSIAVFYSNDSMPRSGDQHFPFRQDSALFALSGLDQPGTIIVLFPDALDDALKEIAFILPSDPQDATWNGKRLTIREAKKISGMTSVKTIDAWDKIMPSLFQSVDSMYVHPAEENVSSGANRIDLLVEKYDSLTILDVQPILQQLQMIKHPQEISLMKHAIEITGLAFDRVLGLLHPGMKEYEVEAELTYVLSRNGCLHAFEPIVASGKSACTLHYTTNDHIIKSDTLVLLDFGAEYAHMASDMTRTIPASGRFTKRQRQIYDAVLYVLLEVTVMMAPGVTIAQLNHEAAKLIEAALVSLRVIRKHEIRRQSKDAPLWKKYFMHGVSHHLGFDVHDTSDRTKPLTPGMVLTCEPGIYIPEENTGIRLENDILITRNGPRNLMKKIPIHPDEIESIMNIRRS